MEKPREFTCTDCGVHVIMFNPRHANDVDICVTCLWLRLIEDPEERKKVREFLRRDR